MKPTSKLEKSAKAEGSTTQTPAASPTSPSLVQPHKETIVNKCNNDARSPIHPSHEKPSKNASRAAHQVRNLGISRRTFLKGAGVSMGLPFLEAMIPRSVRAQDQLRPKRFMAFFVPNGIHMPAWTPTSAGSDFTLPPILNPLSSLRSEVSVLSGFSNVAATPQGDGPGDHARGTSCFLTCAHPVKTEGANISIGPSVDQLLASHFSGETTLPSLELGCEGGGSTGGCDSGYSCAYSRNISWRSATTPAAKEINPRSVFDRLFAGFVPGESQDALARKLRYKQSILDFVLSDAQSLSNRLGNRDRLKMDEYLTGLRELEQRIELAGQMDDGPSCQPFERPTGIPNQLQEHVRLMLDLVVLAFQCDMTRVATFMLGNGGSNRSYGFIGVPGAHHEISHHQNDPAKHAQLQTIDTWEVEQFAYFLDRLAQAQDGTGSLLDQSMVFFSSEIADGNAHGHYNLPVLLAGRGGGTLQPGRHIQFGNNMPIANLYLTLMQNMGMDIQAFGDDGVAALTGL